MKPRTLCAGTWASCHRFEANQARLKMGALAYDLLRMIREFHLKGEDVKRSMEWLVRRIIKAASRISYSGRRWRVHAASSFTTTGRCLARAERWFLIDQVKEVGLLFCEAGGFELLPCLWHIMTGITKRNAFWGS